MKCEIFSLLLMYGESFHIQSDSHRQSSFSNEHWRDAEVFVGVYDLVSTCWQ